jgi:hypothetical protein
MPFAFAAAALPLPLAGAGAPPAEDAGGDGPEVGESTTLVSTAAEPARSFPDFERGGRAMSVHACAY